MHGGSESAVLMFCRCFALLVVMFENARRASSKKGMQTWKLRKGPLYLFVTYKTSVRCTTHRRVTRCFAVRTQKLLTKEPACGALACTTHQGSQDASVRMQNWLEEIGSASRPRTVATRNPPDHIQRPAAPGLSLTRLVSTAWLLIERCGAGAAMGRMVGREARRTHRLGRAAAGRTCVARTNSLLRRANAPAHLSRPSWGR